MSHRITMKLTVSLALLGGIEGRTSWAQTPAPAPLKQFQVAGVEPKAADGDSPLPVGFPPATAAGVIEIKTYPPYRSARARGEKMSISSSDFLFWSLFRHIEKNDIAMTAPVINTYPRPLMDEPKARGEVSMEFLYRDPSMGHTGPDGPSVEVIDRPAETYLCLGVQGNVGEKRMREAMGVLDAWLAQHAAEWTVAGPPRRLGYHGPMTATNRRLWEVQIPILRVTPTDPATTAPTPAPASPNL